MYKNSYPGKFIVLEGLDGSGKSTQTKMLSRFLKREGYKIAKIDFPQYKNKSAGPLIDYLNGKYGKPEEVTPYQASLFYACDRFDASFKIKNWLKMGRIVVSDRYVASNIGHQGGKIRSMEEWKRYVEWLYDLEYNIFKIPRPKITFILRTSSKLSKRLSPKITDEEKKKKRKSYLKNKVRDIHERDSVHLDNALKSYLRVAKEFPQYFKVINCLDNKRNLLPPEIIHRKITREVKKIL